jgi:hypothetical protein
MALTVETGAGVQGADSYATLQECIDYAVAMYGHSLSGNTADKEAAIRRAFAYLSTLNWKGTRTYGRAQGGAWPRTGADDCEGYSIGSGDIPAEVIAAQHELARAEFLSPGILTPSGSKASANVIMEKVDVIQVQYDTDNLTGTIDDIRPIVTAAMDKIKCFLASDPSAIRFFMTVA